jgi:hypothetical protein
VSQNEGIEEEPGRNGTVPGGNKETTLSSFVTVD